MTYARLRDILGMLDKGEQSQDVKVLINGKLYSIDFVDSFRGNKEFANKFDGQPHQVFLTNNKEL